MGEGDKEERGERRGEGEVCDSVFPVNKQKRHCHGIFGIFSSFMNLIMNLMTKMDFQVILFSRRYSQNKDYALCYTVQHGVESTFLNFKLEYLRKSKITGKF